MSLIKESWEEFKAAYGLRLLVLSGTVSGVVAFIDKIISWMAGHGMIANAVGFPNWVLALLVFFGWSGAILLAHAVKLRRTVTPRFNLAFEPAGLGVVGSKTSYQSPGPTPGTISIGEVKSVHIRIVAEAATKVPLHDGAAFIAKVWFRPLGSSSFNEIPLPQYIPLNDTPLTMYPGIPCIVDFAVATEDIGGGSDKFMIARNWPLVLAHKIGPHGIYRFKIVVFAEGSTKHRCADVDWRGDHATILGHKVPDAEC